jgi:diguanylate cyclase (GGDEF)-like protein/PAS domain S-box-containing protein
LEVHPLSEDAPERQSLDDIFHSVRALIARLTRSTAFESGDVEGALAQLTEASATALQVERTSVWQFNPDRSELICLDLYERTPKRHGKLPPLRSCDTPRYFRALAEERTVAAHDARADLRTREFAGGYLEQHGIGAMLDAPVLLEGRLVGVVCHEHVGGVRAWRPWEELLAGTMADFVAMILGAAERARQARALEEYKRKLERLVAQRTSELQQSEANFRHLFQAAPVALVLTSGDDHRVIAANPSAAELFGFGDENPAGQYAPDYWVDVGERERLVREVRVEGRVDRFQAQLRRRDGSTFWGDLAVCSLEIPERALLFGMRDVSAQKQAEHVLRQSRETLLTLFDAAPIPLVLTGLDDAVIRACNQRAASMFEATVEDTVGRRAPDFYRDPEERELFLDQLKRHGRVDGFATELKTRSGRVFWALLNAKTLTVEGQPMFMVGFQDLSEQKQIESDLRELATTDALTGALNRRRLFEVADEELERATRYERPLALAMLDIDHFKHVNDRFGHLVGDQALKLVVDTVRAVLRRQDYVCRYGGEELAVLLPETSLDSAHQVVERMRRAVQSISLLHEGTAVPLTLSAGVVEHRRGEGFTRLLRRADEALYEAKSAGRNRVVASA